MIERYSRPQMKRVWSDENKYNKWLDVEIAACDAWADALEVDADYPPDNAEVMGVRLMVYGDQCTMLYERHSSAAYLRQMAADGRSSAVTPEVADHLNAAAALYDKTASKKVFNNWIETVFLF